MKRHIKRDGSSPLSVLLLYFAEIVTLLVMKTEVLPRPPWENWRIFAPPWPDCGQNACVPCDCVRDILTDYWATTNQLYSSAMKQDRILHILRFVLFTDNNNEPDMMDENSDGLWKMRNLFEVLAKIFSKFYSPSEHLDVDEVIVFLKGRVIFRQYVTRNTNVLASVLTTHVTRLDTHTIWQFILSLMGWGNFI